MSLGRKVVKTYALTAFYRVIYLKRLHSIHNKPQTKRTQRIKYDMDVIVIVKYYMLLFLTTIPNFVGIVLYWIHVLCDGLISYIPYLCKRLCKSKMITSTLPVTLQKKRDVLHVMFFINIRVFNFFLCGGI